MKTDALPRHIDPAVSPGNVVLFVYGLPSGMTHDTQMASNATLAAYLAGQRYADVMASCQAVRDDEIKLVAYSGDTGERIEP